MAKGKERPIVTVSRNGRTSKVMSVPLAMDLVDVFDKVELEYGLVDSGLILYLDKRLDKVLDEDACTSTSLLPALRSTGLLA